MRRGFFNNNLAQRAVEAKAKAQTALAARHRHLLTGAQEPSRDLFTPANSADATAETAVVPKAPGASRAPTGGEVDAEATWQVYLRQLQQHVNNGGTVSVEDAEAMDWRRSRFAPNDCGWVDTVGTIRSAQVEQPWPAQPRIPLWHPIRTGPGAGWSIITTMRPILRAELPPEWRLPPSQAMVNMFAQNLRCAPAEVGCTTAISLPEHPIAVAYVNQLDNLPSVDTVSVILHNFDSFLATHGLTATDGTLQHIIDQGFPDMIIERSAWVEAEQPNPRYPPLRQ